MSRIKEIKNRIKSVKDVQQITRAMKMVAAARLRKIEAKFLYSKNYLENIESVVSFVFNRNAWVKTPLIVGNDSDRQGFLVFSGDKGLCGAFNMNVLKKSLIEINKAENPFVLGVGKKCNSLLKKQGVDLKLNVSGIFGKVRYEDAISISKKITTLFLNGEFKTLSIVLNRFKSKDEESVQIIQLLPLSIPEKEYDDLDYVYDNGVEGTLDSLLSYYLSIKIYNYLLESEAAEFFARMTAMDSASDNAAELIEKLSLEYNRARQAAITKEILDIVGGAEAIK